MVTCNGFSVYVTGVLIVIPGVLTLEMVAFALMGWRGVHGHGDARSGEEGPVVWRELGGTCHGSTVRGPALEEQRHLRSVAETHRVQRCAEAHQAAPL